MGSMFAEVADFEAKLGLPKGFYEQLSYEDDWSFVVKLNALFEAACTHALAQRLRAPEITDALSYLDFAAPKCGKIWLLRDLAAITSDQAKFLAKLAEVRNMIVHKVEHAAFSFDEYLARIEKSKRSPLVAAFAYGFNDSIEVGETMIPRTQFVLENMKLAVWLGAAEILACLHLEFAFAELYRKQLALPAFGGLLGAAGNLGFGNKS